MHHPLVTLYANALRQGNDFSTIRAVRKMAAPYNLSNKEIEEYFEQALVLIAKENPDYDRILSLWEQQPNLGTRTSSSIALQSFSTPLPIAYWMGELLGKCPEARICDPTAGHGVLGINLATDQFYVNEIDSQRRDFLTEILGEQYVTGGNATAWYPSLRFNGVIINPPFSDIQPREYRLGSLKIKRLDCFLILRFMQFLTAGGTLVALMGGSRQLSPEKRLAYYRRWDMAPFWLTIFKRYAVTFHATLPGKLYQKQGASYPVDILRIENRSPTSKDCTRPTSEAGLPPLAGEDMRQLKYFFQNLLYPTPADTIE